MKSIKHLPRAVHSSLRSSTILFDLTRVVEELIFNSVDAGATKVSVSVGVGTCYVKVEDDGSGITRDGLVLLGERYATSKLHCLAEMDASTGSFGFRGEALGSLSDVSLLEIITKARGRPNGYCKVMKGFKCLYLGIYANRQDVGTTVIVRDLFYNQPVRRKYMQSSPKKVLHSVKKCVLRIALVRPQVSFKVIDIESEDELLCTRPSMSPLSLVTSGFGIDISSSLHELNFSEGVLKLSGFLSGPGYSFSMKDWVPVLSFIEKAITHLWRKDVLQGKFHSHADEVTGQDEMWKEDENIVLPAEELIPKDVLSLELFNVHVPANSEITKEKCRIQHRQTSLSPSPFSLELPSEEGERMSHRKNHRMQSRKLHRTGEFKGKHTKTAFVHQMDYSLQDTPTTTITKHISSPREESGSHLWALDNGLFAVEDNFLTNELTATRSSKDNVRDNILGSRWENESLEVDLNMSKGSTRSTIPWDYFEYKNNIEKFPDCPKDLKKPFLQSCSLLGNLPPDEFANHEGSKIQFDGFRTKRKRFDSDNMINAVDADDSNKCFDIFPRISWQEDAAISRLSSSTIDVLPRDFVRPHTFDRQFFDEENDSCIDSILQVGKIGLDRQSTNSEWHSVTPYPLFGTPPWKDAHLTGEYALEGSFRSCRSSSSGHLICREGKDERGVFSFDPMQNSSTAEDCPTSSYTNTTVDYNDYASPKSDICKFLHHGNHLDDFVFPKFGCFDKLTDETDWLCLDLCTTEQTDKCAVPAYFTPSPSYNIKNIDLWDQLGSQNCRQYHVPKGRTRRSHSAPPFYKGKSKFSPLFNRLTTTAGGEPVVQAIHGALTLPVISDFKHPSQSCCVSQQYFEPSLTEGSLFYTRSRMKNMADITQDMNEIHKNEELEKSQCLQIYNTDSIEDLTVRELEDSKFSGIKVQNGNSQITAECDGDKSHNLHDQSNILDISSGILHLAGDSLVPESINKDCLEEAKVLLQVDRKFIPVMAGGTLVIIDQHAADERIRLEELRRKVLSGEEKAVTYLDSEQELLAETDGSSTMPPSVIRVLNFKACRGAIMFGDSLLPSECSLILEELKQTSLCFQCAHGRPTTAPLVNLDVLHKQIAKLGLWNGGSNETWHGLRRYRISLERATQRLSLARGQC
ncbi:hypothetical protein HHK36_010462 [Tetracentron sinense]|uniref:MutL C-terminal dimerisation domain-containing protein n=1 Tax=Tetracentron sinense TaxID=13715 RepID=A0A834ZH01_TETSI|nr:hypothetical protein HHK36_010462 [Tetracentron sinense]